MANKKTDVFFCSAALEGERKEIAQKCVDWWYAQPDVRVVVLTPRHVGCDVKQFQSLRRIIADRMARTEFYVCADDDLIPHSSLEVGLDAIRSHQDFGIVSAWPSNANIHRWTPEDYIPFEDLDVMEHVSVGGLRICRRGAMDKGWPLQTERSYDREHCEGMRSAGYRVGYSQHWRAEHLGEGKSTVWSR